MKLLWEIVQFLFYTGLIVVISKYLLFRTLRSLAENLKLKPKTVGDIAGVATSVPELLTISASSLSGLNTAGIYNIISSNVINLIQYFFLVLLRYTLPDPVRFFQQNHLLLIYALLQTQFLKTQIKPRQFLLI